MATIKVGSNKLITVGYYSVISGVYAFTLLGIGIYNMMAYAILLFSVISGAYTVYYWKWNIELTDRGTIIIQSGRNNYHIKMDNVKEVIRVPLFGYWVISNEGNILFHFSLTMDNISKLWLFLRGKVK